tara:strand:+ start:78 stop:215 length:138 start_codon:yes stop_codon:yes gene_type:complete
MLGPIVKLLMQICAQLLRLDIRALNVKPVHELEYLVILGEKKCST